MASRKLVRDFLLSKWHYQSLRQHYQPVRYTQIGLLSDIRLPSGSRQFGVLNEFSKQVKGEAKSNSEFQQSLRELNEKVGGMKDDLKARTKQTTEKLYKHVDEIWTEAEATTKKVSVNVKEKLSSATEEVKEKMKFVREESVGSTSSSSHSSAGMNGENDSACGADEVQHSKSDAHEQSDVKSDTIFGKFKSASTIISPKVSMAFNKLKEARVLDAVKKGYVFLKDELDSSPSKRRQMQYASAVPKGERSSRTDIVVLPSKQSRLSKKWDELKQKMRGHPIFKRVSGISEPVVTKGQELAEDMRERWETSDSPVVHKIQDLNETVFGETATALSFKEIRRRDPSFSLPDFVAEVQEMIRPTLTAYLKCDVDTLKKYCSPEVIERCKGERTAYESQGFFFDNKILHISEVDVRETKMLGSSPIIVVAFQTQQIYCIRDKEGVIKEGGKDSIQTVYYGWALQQIDAEELGEGALYPAWRLRGMQQIGVQALI